MAANTYPKISAAAWSALRTRAATAPTIRFTPDVVAALMQMSSPDSALRNTVTPMRRLGLIDDEGALTDRGNRWRVDSSFDAVCQEILDEIYPEALNVLVDNDEGPYATKIRTWFDHQGFGDSNARQMSATYVMIASKRIPEPPTKDSRKAKQEASSTKKSARKPKETEKAHAVAAHEPLTPPEAFDRGPTVHLDIQIHIPADATPEQIDQIFSSMARHLYSK